MEHVTTRDLFRPNGWTQGELEPYLQLALSAGHSPKREQRSATRSKTKSKLKCVVGKDAKRFCAGKGRFKGRWWICVGKGHSATDN